MRSNGRVNPPESGLFIRSGSAGDSFPAEELSEMPNPKYNLRNVLQTIHLVMGSSLPKVRDFPVMKCRYIVPLDPAYLPTAGKQGGAWGALAGQIKSLC